MTMMRAVQILFGCTISLIIWPLIIVVFLINEIVRVILSIVLHGTRFELVKDPLDNVYYNKNLTTPIIIACFFSPDPVNLHDEREMWSKILFTDPTQTYAKLKKTLVTKYGYAMMRNDEGDNFKLENHVKYYHEKLKDDDNVIITEEELDRIILPSLQKNMASTQPQWSWLLIPKLVRRKNGEIHSVRIFRWHHSYLDGVSVGLLLGDRIFDKITPSSYIKHPKVGVTITPLKQFIANLWSIFNLPFVLTFLILIGKLLQKLQERKITRSTNNIRTSIFSGPIGVKIDKEDYGKNIASHFIKCISETMKEFGLTQNTSKILTFTPLALLPYKNSKPKNKLLGIFFEIPVSAENETTKLSLPKATLNDFIFPMAVKFLGRFPIAIMYNLFDAGENTQLLINNIPFFKKKETINGGRIEDIGAWNVLLKPINLAITIVGYGGEAFINVVSLEEIMSVERLDHFLSSLAYKVSDKIIV